MPEFGPNDLDKILRGPGTPRQIAKKLAKVAASSPMGKKHGMKPPPEIMPMLPPDEQQYYDELDRLANEP